MQRHLHEPLFVCYLKGISNTPDAHRSPAVADVHYNRGGQLVRNYNRPDVLEQALPMLKLAKEIYQENGRERKAAYASTFAAEALIKLGRFPEARRLIEFARNYLKEDRDKSALDYCQRMEEKMREEE